MNNIFYIKIDNIKFLGKTIFSKETVYNETDRDTDYDIIVKPDYFDKEFKINDKKE